MLNFTVGPVQSSDNVRKIGGEQVPYFRTEEFSNIMLENERLIKKFSNSGENSRVVFITGSGTASMEASVINTLTREDKLLIVNGGSFGQRFAEICNIHELNYTEIKLESGCKLKSSDLEPYDNKGYTAFIVNVDETSTGVYYDLNLIHEFCKKNNLFLIVDAISSFLADELDMQKYEIDVMITGSQKALACPPGISVIVLRENALKRVQNTNPKCMYLDLKNALLNGERGQTPFTPAVGILLQINERLKEIEKNGGVESEIRKISSIANDFRNRIKDLPLKITSESLSNAVTPLSPLNVSAYDVFLTLKDKYDIWVCPNGGDLKEKIFRVGHIGDLTIEDNDKLILALKDMADKHLL